jgi:hypothetical protein
MGSSGRGDIDESRPTGGRRVTLAAAVASGWMVAALPVVLGLQHCPVAALLHRPCPGCGVTRALELLAAGHAGASMRMHPLALPALAAVVLLASSTIWATLASGSPALFHRGQLGRIAMAAMAIVYVAALILWGARSFGYFGGPVPV